MKITQPQNQFAKVRCTKCKNEQVIFRKAASIVKCTVCEKELATPTGGLSRVKAKVVEVLN